MKYVENKGKKQWEFLIRSEPVGVSHFLQTV